MLHNTKLITGLCRSFVNNCKVQVKTYSTTPNKVASTANPSSGTDRAAVYELRTYDIKPEFMPDFLNLTTNYIHLRTKHSPLLGYWATELGGINQVVHLWEYTDLDHRAKVRTTLGGDKNWNTYYMDKMRPMLVSQKNLVLHKFPWSVITPPANSENIYELRQYTLKPGATQTWANIWTKGLPSRVKYSKPYAVFFSEIGELNNVVHLWPYTSYADRAQVRKEAGLDDSWKQVVEQTMEHISVMNNKVLIPTVFSPLK